MCNVNGMEWNRTDGWIDAGFVNKIWVCGGFIFCIGYKLALAKKKL
jgi:hypothetical protein